MSGRFRAAWGIVLRRWDLRVTVPLALISLVVILPALGWGIPNFAGPERLHGWGNDDQVPLASLAQMQNSLFGSPSNRNYAYPLGQHLVWSAFYAPVMGFEFATGGIQGVSSEYPFGFQDPQKSLRRLAWIGRSVTAAMAVICILSVYAAGRFMGSRAAGVLAALSMLFTWPFLYYARTGNPDVPTLMWTAIGVAATAWILRDGFHRIPGILLGIAVAAGGAAKTQAFGSFVLVVPALVGVALLAPSQRSFRDRFNCVLVSGVAFAVTTVVMQGIWLDPAFFVRHIQLVLGAATGSGPGPGGPRYGSDLHGVLSQVMDLGFHVIDAMTLPMLLVAIVGMGWVALRRSRYVVLLLSPIGFLVMLLPVGFSRIHYVLAIVLVLQLFAGYFLGRALEHKRSRFVTIPIVTLLFVVPVLRAADLTHSMRNDSRYDAAAWLADRTKPGDRVTFFGAPMKLPPLKSDVKTLEVTYAKDAAKTLTKERPEWLLVIPEDTDEHRRRVPWRKGPLSVRSAYMPAELYERLGSGEADYRLVAQFQSPRLLPNLATPFLTYPTVNPPVQIFLREDRAAEFPRLRLWNTAPFYPPVGRINEPPIPLVDSNL